MNKVHNLLVCECSECINYWVDLTNNMVYNQKITPPTGEIYYNKDNDSAWVYKNRN